MTSERATYQPLPVWKLAVLLLTTATLYQFVWLFNVARELNRSRQLGLTPWHWAGIPFLGPLMVLPAYYLASRLKEWQVEEDRQIGHLAEPVLIATLVIIAYLPLYLVMIETSSILVAAVLISLFLCVPYLALQAQLNLNLGDAEAAPTPGLFARHQFASMAVGLLLAVPLYLYTFTDTWERRGSNELTVGDVIASDRGHFRVKVGDDGWTQIKTGYLSEDADLEFLGPDDWTWALVYDNAGMDIDSVMSFRASQVRSDYRGAQCELLKTLDPDSLIVVGTVECSGRNAIDGSFIVLARVLGDRTSTIEIVASTAQSDPRNYEQMMPRVRDFADGLELEQ